MKARVAVLLALVVTGCATIQFAPRKPMALDRRLPPFAIDSSAAPLASVMPSAGIVVLPPTTAPTEARLSNGIRVLVVEQHITPLIAMGLVLQRGSVEAPPAIFGVFVDSFASGSDLISPKALHTDLFTYAIHRNIDVHQEYARVSVQFVAPVLHDVVRMIAPTFVTPSFDSEELELLVDQHKRKISRVRDEPRAYARRQLDKLLFPNSPYGESAEDEHALDGVTVDTVRKLGDVVRADDVAVVVAGDVTLAKIQPMLEETLGSLKPGARARRAIPDAPPSTNGRVLVLDHAGDSQAQLALGYPGVRYDHPDFIALFALSKIVQEGARKSLRLAHGVTYAVSGDLPMMRYSAPVVLAAAVDVHRVGQALRDALGAISNFEQRVRDEGELGRLKSWIVANYTTHDTVDEALESLVPIAALDLPVDHLAKLRAGIEALTADDLVRVAKQYLDPSHAHVVVLGDASLVRTEIEALGIGEVEVRKVVH